MRPEGNRKQILLALLREHGHASTTQLAGRLELDATDENLEEIGQQLRQIPEAEFVRVLHGVEEWRLKPLNLDSQSATRFLSGLSP